ncbi:DUF2635 domain-containing protein [Siccirubricoccus sp. KC 17139]|uniref:DUF2635 domain-containing protein n=1 Tax=Siccirubricoccus soli TaxID=2899147 RepID=A0ABT1CYT6_9PROT|nr:DUF2635 domain-containing protein [Siccirubricoccus soli]MCO6414814.1 DUF2635 domain-containing protein [Siccirubricoccus soli]MCP2680944.1 DUF2635 domain-containing protein [Siccirubricoccus soli]
MHVIPAPGLVVLDPDTFETLPPEGRVVPPSEYWLRRLRDADVALAPTPEAAKKAAKRSPTTPAETGPVS